MSNYIHILDFDSDLFGFKVGKYLGRQLSIEIAEEIIKECKADKVKCVYMVLNIDDFVSINNALKYDFVISDIRMTLEKDLCNFNAEAYKLNGYKIDDSIRNDDIPVLELLSQEISKVSRFASDKNFSQERVKKLYRIWITNSIKKKVADIVLVAKELNTGKPIGVITFKKESKHGEIVLIGVDQEHFGKGIGTFLINSMCSFAKKEGFNKIRVVTQGRNIRALRLYQKSGFYIHNIQIFFHLWMDRGRK